MMATFLFMMCREAEVAPRAIVEVLDTEPDIIISRRTRCAARSHAANLDLRDVVFRYPGDEERCCTASAGGPARRSYSHNGGTGSGKKHC